MRKSDIVVSHKQRNDRLGSFSFINLFYYAYCELHKYQFKICHENSNVWFDAEDLYSFFGWDQLMGFTDKDSCLCRANSFDKLLAYNENRNVNLFCSEVEDLEREMIDTHGFSHYFPDSLVKKLYNTFVVTNTDIKPVYFDQNKINIAIHIRRGDVSSAFFQHAYFSNKVFVNLINHLNYLYADADIHIFACETNEEGWDDFVDLNCTIHLRKDFSKDNLKYEKIDLLHFIMADVLVIGGTFSYVPAFLNKNVVFYPEMFWHSPLEKWIKYDEEGHIT